MPPVRVDKLTAEDVARLVVRKTELDIELKSIRQQIKMANISFPFAVQIDDNIVVIKKPTYSSGMPMTEVIPLLGIGQ